MDPDGASVGAPPLVTPYLLSGCFQPMAEHHRATNSGPHMQEGDSSDGQFWLEDLPSAWPKLS